MTDVFTVSFVSLPDKKHSCFFYFNEHAIHKKLKDCKSSSYNLRIQFGTNFSKHHYVSFNPQPSGEVPSDTMVGVTPVYAQRLGLQEDDKILVSLCDSHALHTVCVRPKHEDDYTILVTCKNSLEKQILNQVRVVTLHQTLPIQVFGNVTIDLYIDKLEPNVPYGQLEQFTELVILDPKEINQMGNLVVPTLGPDILPFEERVDNSKDSLLSQLFSRVSQLLSQQKTENSSTINQHEEIKDPLLKIVSQKKVNSSKEFRAVPLSNLPNYLQYKHFLLTYHGFGKNLSGPASLKIPCKITKIEEKTAPRNANEHQTDPKLTENSLFAFVICPFEKEPVNPNCVYCPRVFMKKLKLQLGSRIRVEEVKENGSFRIENSNYVELSPTVEPVKAKPIFWTSMVNVKNNILKVIHDNSSGDQTMNVLLLGSPGTGKSHMLESVIDELAKNSVFASKLDCKPLKGKKTDSIHKELMKYLSECAYHQPAVLIMDDVDALMNVQNVGEQENQFHTVYVNRIGTILNEVTRSFQCNNDITVVASCQSLSQLGKEISTTRGSRLFEVMLEVAEMKADERVLMLRELMGKHDEKMLGDISDRTKGYNIQDIVDLVERAVLKSLVRGPEEELLWSDFEMALTETVPLSLRGVELHKDMPHSWSDIGGLSEAKSVLTEVFLWPSRHPEIFASCPIRHQTGVLLFGAPGTGKTLLAGAIGAKCGLNFISIKGPELLSKYVGASEEGVRNVFKRAQRAQPCVLFFDEFDSLAPRRGHDSTGVTDRVVNQLLTQLDGVESLTGVWVLAATSRPDLLDPALLRPGRLDRAIHCALPGQDDRLSILKALSKNLGLADDVDLSAVAAATEGYTGADLQSVLYCAQMMSIKELTKNAESGTVFQEKKVPQSHLLAAVTETKPSLSTFEKLKYDKIYERFVKTRGSDFSDTLITREQKITFA